MSHGLGIDNFNLGLCMKGRQLDLGRADLRLSFFSEIYSPIPIDFRRMHMYAFPP
jgi:hypothetical protein